MTNLFPLPYWAPALKRVPIPLQALDDALTSDDRSVKRGLFDERASGLRSFLLAQDGRTHAAFLALATASARRSR
jgi:hypothetical protein